MKNFFSLAAFEYKKIWQRKSTKVSLVLALILTVFSCVGTLIGNLYFEGKIYESNYKVMVKNRTSERSFAGRAVDETLFLEAAKAGQMVDDKKELTLEEWEKYIWPFETICYLGRDVYDKNMSKLSQEEMQSYYNLRDQALENEVDEMPLNRQSKQKLISLNTKIKRPFTYDYIGGYYRFITVMVFIGISACFAGAICCAPIFAGEHKDKMDQLILSSKYGKKKLVFVKLFVGLTLAFCYALLLLGVSFFECLSVFGSDGREAVCQLWQPMSPYPMTMGQVALAVGICMLCANLLNGAMTLCLSAKLRTSFSVIIITIIVMILPFFVHIDERNIHLYKLFKLLPTNMMDRENVISPYLYEIFHLSIEPYIWMPIFAIIGTIIFSVIVCLGSRKQQVY